MPKNDKNVTRSGRHCELFGKLRTGQGAAIQLIKSAFMNRASGLPRRCAPRNDRLFWFWLVRLRDMGPSENRDSGFPTHHFQLSASIFRL